MYSNARIKNNKAVKQKAVKSTDIQQSEGVCPFCKENRPFTLAENQYIIDEKHGFILLDNKYPTYENWRMLLLIELYHCDRQIEDYTLEEFSALYDFLKLSIAKQKELYPNDNEVMIFKQRGKLAGGSIEHPHIQILSTDKPTINHSRVYTMLKNGDEVYNNGNLQIRFNTENISESEAYIFEFYDGIDRELLMTKIQSVIKYFSDFTDNYSFGYHRYKNKNYLQLTPRKYQSSCYINFGLPISNIIGEEELNGLIELLKD